MTGPVSLYVWFSMSLKIDEIMKSRVITVTPHQTAGHVRELLEKNKINIEVSLPSQTHQTPQIGLPHKLPVTRVMTAKPVPIGAIERAAISANGCRQIRKKNAHIPNSK